MALGNDHGWINAPLAPDRPDGVISAQFAQIVPQRERCDCRHTPCGAICTRRATQEDLLCDECRETCR